DFLQHCAPVHGLRLFLLGQLPNFAKVNGKRRIPGANTNDGRDVASTDALGTDLKPLLAGKIGGGSETDGAHDSSTPTSSLQTHDSHSRSRSAAQREAY